MTLFLHKHLHASPVSIFNAFIRVTEKLYDHNLMPRPMPGWAVPGPSGAESWAAGPGMCTGGEGHRE